MKKIAILMLIALAAATNLIPSNPGVLATPTPTQTTPSGGFFTS